MLLARASHEDAVAALREADTDGLVGPTTPSGWTCVRVEDDEFEAIEHVDFGAYLWAGEARAGLTIELMQRDDGSERLSWSQGSDTFAMNALFLGVSGRASSMAVLT